MNYRIYPLEKRLFNIIKKASKPSKKQRNNSTVRNSPNALRESNLPNRQQQKEILAFERERNKILKEILKLGKN
ncbi:hypothetical protein RhiirA4_466275 [Rhizophagus irregularis]|uniref:Uncharacterized protein n=1 Tax=Rhizophagus irregularis TaxID=588596 RepID=A0A2I1GTQ8_9GLOM|nr:hypothetical protein RhiirA4_466275 [Rhizophagus irregularis]